MENQPVSPDLPLCPACHTAVQAEWKNCPNCGHRLDRKAIPRRYFLLGGGAVLLTALLVVLLVLQPWRNGPPLAQAPDLSNTPPPAQTVTPTQTLAPQPTGTRTRPPTVTHTSRPSPTSTPTRTPIQLLGGTGQSGGIGMGSNRSKTMAAQPVTVVTAMRGLTLVPTVDPSAFTRPAAPPPASQNQPAPLSPGSGLCVSYYNRSQGDLYYTCRTDTGTWGAPFPRPLDTQGNVGLYTSLVFDPQKQPWIAYYDQTNGDLKVATEQDGRWILLVVDSQGNTGKYPAIAVGRDGLPIIAYYDVTRAMLRLARATQGGWYLQDVEPVGKISEDYRLAIQVDTGGVIYLAYQNNLDRKLMLTRLIDEQFTTEVVDTDKNVAQFTSLALYPDGRVGISYYGQGTRHLRYAFGSPGGWYSTWISQADESGRYNALVISASGHPYATFFLENPDSLLVASSDSGFWQKITLQKNKLTGQHTSLAINQQGQLAVSYYDGKWLNVGIGPTVNWYDTYLWRFESVDTSGDTGLYSSIQYR